MDIVGTEFFGACLDNTGLLEFWAERLTFTLSLQGGVAILWCVFALLNRSFDTKTTEKINIASLFCFFSHFLFGAELLWRANFAKRPGQSPMQQFVGGDRTSLAGAAGQLASSPPLSLTTSRYSAE